MAALDFPHAADLLGAPRQRIRICKTTWLTATAGFPYSTFDFTGIPAPGTVAGVSTNPGQCPTNQITGFPLIAPFQASAYGYISRIAASCTVACRITLYDMLFKAGAYPFNAAVSGIPYASFLSRLVEDYTGLELWYEQVTATTGIQSVNVTYDNESGASKSTGAVSLGVATIRNRLARLPLAAGDKGIMGITGVTGSVATVGTFNLLIMRPLAEVRIRVANDSVIQDALSTGLPRVFSNSALYMVVTPDSANTGIAEMLIDIIDG